MSEAAVTEIEHGVYRVEIDGRATIVYVAGRAGARWASWNGRVFLEARETKGRLSRSGSRQATSQTLSAPMPATVLKVLVSPGAVVRKGDSLVILEAMKMEWPLRAEGDATVTAVRCREGELVQPDDVLVELS